jgi:cyclopropane-fatty-acyl-phospholipid synthase
MDHQSEPLAGEEVHGLTSPARVFRSWILRKLAGLTEVVIVLRDGGGEVECRNPNANPNAKRILITVLNPATYQRIAFLGVNGAITTFAEGMWVASDLRALIHALQANPETFRSLNGGLQRLPQPLARVAGNFITLGATDRLTYLDKALSRLMIHLCRLLDTQVDDSLSLSSLRTVWESVRSVGLLRVRSFDHVLVTHALGPASALKVGGDYGANVIVLVSSPEEQHRFKRAIQAKGSEKQVVVRFSTLGKVRSRYSRILTQLLAGENHAEFWQSYVATLGRVLTDDGIAVVETLCRSPKKFDAGSSSQSDRQLSKNFSPLSIGEMVSLLVDEHHLQILFMEDFTDAFENAVRDSYKMILSPVSQEAEPAPDTQLTRSWEMALAVTESAIAGDRLRAVRLVLKR